MSTPNLAGFDRKAQSLIRDMLEAGWTGRVSSKGHFIARAPDGETTTSVPRNLDAPNRARQNSQATFDRWKRANAEQAAPVPSTPSPAPPPSITPPPLPAAPRVVSEGPWLALRSPSRSGGTRYESGAVLERLYDDGSTVYVCAAGCGFTATVARAVSSHYASHVRAGEAEATTSARDLSIVPATDYTEPLTTREYQPSDRLVAALTEFLRFNMGSGESPEFLARMFLTWAHERPDLEHVEREPRKLTAEEIVARVRSLVWSPVAGDLAEARRDASEAREQASEALRAREDAEARLAAMERDISAFKDLLGEVGTGQIGA